MLGEQQAFLCTKEPVMRRSAAALLTRPASPPPSPAPEGLVAVQAAVAAAMRAVDRKFAAVHAAVPSLVLAAPSIGSLLHRTLSSSAIELPASTGHTKTLCQTRQGVLVVVGKASLTRSLSGGDLVQVPSDAGSDLDPERAAGETGDRRLSPREAGPLLSRLRCRQSCQNRPLPKAPNCVGTGLGGWWAQAGARPAVAGIPATWPPTGAAGRRASLGVAACDPRVPGGGRLGPFAHRQAAAKTSGGLGPPESLPAIATRRDISAGLAPSC